MASLMKGVYGAGSGGLVVLLVELPTITLLIRPVVP